MDTVVYIDGFNLYYRALKKNPDCKWLDLLALCKMVLPKDSNIKEINFYTARVSGKISKDAPRKQQIYIKALETCKIIHIHYGDFKIRNKSVKLKEPLEFIPKPKNMGSPLPRFATAVVPEEKGSDVKLGVHLVRDGFQKKYQRAVVITNDVDLAEPLKIVKEELGLEVILLKPEKKALATLDSNASSIIYLELTDLKNCQFPEKIGTIEKPSEWN